MQCLGPEASEFLAERLPAGTEIELDYDEERLDRYDRTLAAVYESESLINAEIAAAGLGIPVYFAPDERFLPEVERAARTAQREALGLYAPEVECTLPAQLQAQSAAPAKKQSTPASTSGSTSGSSSTSDSGATSDSGSKSTSGSTSSSSGGSKSTSSSCVPYGPEIPYADDGGCTGKRHGMPGGKTFRKCS